MPILALDPITITVPMFASTIGQLIIGMMMAIVVIRGLMRFIDTLPVS